MPDFSVNCYYRQFERGWTEQFYVASQKPLGMVLANWVAGVAPASIQLRHPTTILQGIRVRDVASTRNSVIANLQSTRPGTFAATNTPDAVATALRLTINSTAGTSRSLFLRGLEDPYTTRDRTTGKTDTAHWIGPVGDFIQAIAFAEGAVRRLLPVGTAGPLAPLYNWQPVVYFSQGAANTQWTTVALPLGSVVPTKGQFIYFKGLPRPTFDYLRGRLQVMTTPIGTVFEVNATWRTGINPINVPNTSFRLANYGYDLFASHTIAELTEHRTGGPSNRPRGRRSAAFRRRLPLAVQ